MSVIIINGNKMHFIRVPEKIFLYRGLKRISIQEFNRHTRCGYSEIEDVMRIDDNLLLFLDEGIDVEQVMSYSPGKEQMVFHTVSAISDRVVVCNIHTGKMIKTAFEVTRSLREAWE